MRAVQRNEEHLDPAPVIVGKIDGSDVRSWQRDDL